MKMLPAALAALLLAGVTVDAGARAIYRCGADGKTFSQTPCADGTLHESADPRTAAQKAEARRTQQREREREAARGREAQAQQATAAVPAAAVPTTTAQRVAQPPKAGDPGVLTVASPPAKTAPTRP